MKHNKSRIKLSQFLWCALLLFSYSINSYSQTISKVDENGNLLVDNEPFLPLGFYAEYMSFGSFPTLAQDLRADGFNSIVTSVHFNDTSVYKPFLSQCNAIGMKNFISLPRFSSQPTRFSSYISALKNSPSIIGWQLLPNANLEDISVTIEQKEELWQRDSSRISYVYSNQITPPFEYLLDHIEASSLVQEPYGYPWIPFDLDMVAFRYRFQAQKAKEKGVFPMIIAQTLNWEPNPYPSPEHLDAQSYLGYVTGNKGLLFYTYLDTDETETIYTTQNALYNATKNIAEEVLESELKEVFLYGEHEYHSPLAYQHYGTWEYNDFLYVIAVNAHGSDSRYFNFPLPSNADGLAINLFQNRYANLYIQDGILKGLMEPYQVSIVKIALSPLGLQGEENKNIVAYPNPTKGIINISGISSSYSYTLYSITGQQVDFGGNTDNETQIDIRHLPNGIYYLTIIKADNAVSRPIKIVKN